jgi:CBS domain-containing protein
MTRSVQTIAPETTTTDVAKLFAEHEIGSAVVTDDSGELCGIVTESDIMKQIVADADLPTQQVGAFMAAPVITTPSSECIHDAAATMKDHSILRLPVVDDGTLVGILTTSDLVSYVPTLRNAIVRQRKMGSEG